MSQPYALDWLEDVLRKHNGSRFILGVDGLSRAGKTSYVTGMKSELHRLGREARVFHLDDHIVERARRYDTGQEGWTEFYYLQWDIAKLRENLFSKVKWSERVTLPFYHADRDECVTENVTVPTSCVVIIEGVFLQRPEWRPFLDYCVYLDCSRDIRFARESPEAQAKVDKFRTRYWPAEDYYLEIVRPMELAERVMHNESGGTDDE